MAKTMTAIKIDVEKREVYEIEIKPGLAAMYKAIGCRTVELVRITPKDDLWVDEEGLLLDPQPDKFTFRGCAQPLAGNGLVCGHDGEGGTVSTMLTVDMVRERVLFIGDRHIEPQGGFMSQDDLAEELRRLFYR